MATPDAFSRRTIRNAHGPAPCAQESAVFNKRREVAGGGCVRDAQKLFDIIISYRALLFCKRRFLNFISARARRNKSADGRSSGESIDEDVGGRRFLADEISGRARKMRRRVGFRGHSNILQADKVSIGTCRRVVFHRRSFWRRAVCGQYL